LTSIVARVTAGAISLSNCSHFAPIDGTILGDAGYVCFRSRQVRDEAMLAITPLVLPFVQAGKVRLLAVTNKIRCPLAPQAPTAIEAGYPALAFEGLLGFFGPGDVSPALRDRLSSAVAAGPAIVERLARDRSDRPPRHAGGIRRSDRRAAPTNGNHHESAWRHLPWRRTNITSGLALAAMQAEAVFASRDYTSSWKVFLDNSPPSSGEIDLGSKIERARRQCVADHAE
jgi:hypothetical protein